MVTECERELQWANYECLCLKLLPVFCRNCKNSIKVRRLPSFWLYEVRHYKSLRLNPCSNGCTECWDEVDTMTWKWFCHPLRVDRRKGRKYIRVHTWTVPCRYCYFTKYSAYPRGMRENFASVFASFYESRFFVFLLLCLPSVFMSLNICDSSQVPHSYHISLFTSNDTCSQIASLE